MDTDDGVIFGQELTSQSLPSKVILGACSRSPKQACAVVYDSQVQTCPDEVNDIGAPDSFTCSDIPIATHFSPIEFDSWSDMTNLWSGVVNQQVNAEPIPPENHCQAESTELESPRYAPNIDYHNIKWGDPGFYEFGACYYPENWSTCVCNKEKMKWSIRGNSEYGVLLRETLAEVAAADAKSKDQPEMSFPDVK